MLVDSVPSRRWVSRANDHAKIWYGRNAMRHCVKYLLFSLAIVAVVLGIPERASAQPGVVAHMGALPDGATYLIEVPAKWNGTLFLYSHGYVIPGTPNPAQDFAITDPATRFFM